MRRTTATALWAAIRLAGTPGVAFRFGNALFAHRFGRSAFRAQPVTVGTFAMSPERVKRDSQRAAESYGYGWGVRS